MEKSKFSRRDFLKLISTAYISSTGLLHWLAEEFPEEGRSVHFDSNFAISHDRPNILILLFDTMSAHHLSTLNYRRETTPNLSRFSEISNVYHNHYSTGNFTTPGTASLLTGEYPWTHRAINLFGSASSQFSGNNLFSHFPNYHRNIFIQNPVAMPLLHDFRNNVNEVLELNEAPVLGKLFSESIFDDDLPISLLSEKTIRGSVAKPLASSLIFSLMDRYFLFKKLSILEQEPQHNYHWVYAYLNELIDWLKFKIIELPKPFLAYYHFLPPHMPYRPSKEFTGYFDDDWMPPKKTEHFFSTHHSFEDLIKYRQTYDEFIRTVDSELEKLINFLDLHNFFENTYIIITSDHGELFERGVFQHTNPLLYEPLIKIPLIIHQPGQKSRQDIYANTSSVDVLPTLLNLTGYPVPNTLPGQLLPLVNQDRQDSGREIYAFEAKESYKYGRITPYTLSLIFERYKMIHYSGYEGFEDQYELYDLENDPEEMDDLYLKNSKLAAEMKERIRLKEQEINPT